MVEIVAELVIGLVELFAEIAFRDRPTTAEGRDREARAFRYGFVGVLVAASALLGAWRGIEAGDSLAWGFWVAVGAVLLCIVGLVRHEPDSTPPTARWRRLVLWWPPARLWTFLAANAAFAACYLATVLR